MLEVALTPVLGGALSGCGCGGFRCSLPRAPHSSAEITRVSLGLVCNGAAAGSCSEDDDDDDDDDDMRSLLPYLAVKLWLCPGEGRGTGAGSCQVIDPQLKTTKKYRMTQKSQKTTEKKK